MQKSFVSFRIHEDQGYDIRPQNYEQLISISGVGPATVRALSLIGELIYGTRASWQNPVKHPRRAHVPPKGRESIIATLHPAE
jgi:hypothetical protein